MASFAEKVGSFVANPFGAADAGNAALEAIGLGNSKQVKAGQQSLDELISQAQSTGAANKQLFNQYLGQAQDLYGGDVGKYNSMVDQLSAELAQPAETFAYNKDVKEFYDPAANQRVAAAMAGLRANAAGAGSAWSSDFQNRMAAKQQAMASDEWKASYDRLMEDRKQQLAEWEAGQTNRNNRLQAMQGLTNTLGQGRNAYGTALGDYYGNMASQNNATLQQISDLTQARANLGMQEQKGIGAAAGTVGSILGAIF